MFLLLYIKMIFLSYLKNLASLSDYDCHLASRPNQPVDQAAHRGERRLGRFCRPSAGRHLFCLGKNAAPRPRCCCGPRLSTARGQARPASCLMRALRGCPAENGLEVRKPGSLGKKDESCTSEAPAASKWHGRYGEWSVHPFGGSEMAACGPGEIA